MRGRPAKPTALKIAAGNPGQRRIRPEPQPKKPDRPPPAPPSLDRYGKAEWRRQVPELHRLGLLTIVDRTMLEIYCAAVSQWRIAQDWVDKNGQTIVLREKDGRTKSVITAPQVAIARAAGRQAAEIAAQFGFTPASRVRLPAAKPDQPAAGKGRFFTAS